MGDGSCRQATLRLQALCSRDEVKILFFKIVSHHDSTSMDPNKNNFSLWTCPEHRMDGETKK